MVFQDSACANFINAHFVSLKLIGKEGEIKTLQEKIGFLGYPTIMFLNSNGTEIDRLIGFNGDKEKFFQNIQDFTAGKNTLGTLLVEIKNTPEDIDMNYKLATKYMDRYELASADSFFQKVLALDPKNSKGYQEEALFNTANFQSRENKNIEPMLAFLAKSPAEKYITSGYFSIIRFYQREKDTPKVVETYELALERMPKNVDFLNGYAGFIFTDKLSDKYDQGVELAKKALAIEPEDADIWDTLAQLQYATGDVNDAVKSMEKAVQLAPDVEGFKKSLEKFKTGA